MKDGRVKHPLPRDEILPKTLGMDADGSRVRLITMRTAGYSFALLLFTAACGDDPASPPDKPGVTAPAKPSATTAPSVDLAPEPVATGIPPRVKAELDGRQASSDQDQLAMAVPKARGSLKAHRSLELATTDELRLARAKDRKAGVVAGTTDRNEDQLAGFLGLSACRWGADIAVSVGTEPVIKGVANDGRCTRAEGEVPTAKVLYSDQGISVIGFWTPDSSDVKKVFDVMRSIRPASASGAGPDACCTALDANAEVAPQGQQGAYRAAAAACRAALQLAPATMRARVTAALGGNALPPACR